MAITLNGTTGAVTGIVSASSTDLSTALVPRTGATGTINLSTATVTGAGMDLINKTDFTAASSVSVNNVFSNIYDNYKIIITGVGTYTGSGISGGTIKLRSSGVDTSTSDYSWMNTYSTSSIGPSRAWNSANNSWYFFMFDHQNINTIELYTPSGSTKKSGTLTYNASGTIDAVSGVAGMANYVAKSVDGFTLTTPSGTMTGSVRVYGYRNA
jgi:hypothetical protein